LQQKALYYLQEGFYENFNAGIVRRDQEKILQDAGFKPLHFKYTSKNHFFFKALRMVRCLKMAFSLPYKSIVVFHFPLQATVYAWLLNLLKWRNVKTAVLIIDIDGIRDKNEKELQNEIGQLKKFDLLVAHNESMKEALLKYYPFSTIRCIQLFDYPLKEIPRKKKLSNVVCFAGNIAKSGFTSSLSQLQSLHFNIYGHGFDAVLNRQKNVLYKGIVAAELLPQALEGSFGLVWDGGSIEKCADYLRYNNPHKLSLYLVSRLPVIVWKDSAVADFVTENNIGFTIQSLKDIPGKISAITEDKYASMQQQVSILSQQISKGEFLKKIIPEIKAL
jgi:hypothetical protein